MKWWSLEHETEPAFTCSKPTTGTTKRILKIYLKSTTIKIPERCQWLWTDFSQFSSDSIFDFEQVNASWFYSTKWELGPKLLILLVKCWEFAMTRISGKWSRVKHKASRSFVSQTFNKINYYHQACFEENHSEIKKNHIKILTLLGIFALSLPYITSVSIWKKLWKLSLTAQQKHILC